MDTSTSIKLIDFGTAFIALLLFFILIINLKRIEVAKNSKNWPKLGLLFIVLALSPYAFLFDNSYVNFKDEGDYAVPTLNYLAKVHNKSYMFHKI